MGTLENPVVHCHTIRDLLKKIQKIHGEFVDHENTIPKCENCWQNRTDFNAIKGHLYLIVEEHFSPKTDEVCTNFEYVQLEDVVQSEISHLQPMEDVKQEPDVQSEEEQEEQNIDVDMDNDWSSAESFSGAVEEAEDLHKIKRKPSRKEKVSCHFCSKTFLQGKRLTEHIARHHTGDKPFQCNICKKAFKSWDYYTVHCRNHEKTSDETIEPKNLVKKTEPDNKIYKRKSKELSFQCYYCGQSFMKKRQILHHMNEHKNDKSKAFECKICKRKCKTKKIFQNHLRKHENDQEYQKECVENEETSQHCEICKRYFRNTGTLQRHIELRDSYNLSCGICNEKICLTTDLYAHEKLNHKVKTFFQCLHCEEQFSNFKLIYKHHKDKHPKLLGPTKPFLCDICGLTMADSRDLKRHMMIHRGLKPHKCDLCDKTFRLQTEVEQHRRVHIPISELRELYKCDVCPKKFRMKLTLWRHKRIHTGQITEMFCPVCKRRFINSKNLEIHMLKHANEAPRPFKCDICGKYFKIRKEYNIHMKRKHEIFSLDRTRMKKKT